ncbi:hypothetical protein EC957_002612 [Mortierella hygrophila]|uniref:Uncharacterized protein n=1 Tax=Mortierella hygrophila TaxID=979708 RepID=A0A9P6K110_9FUNG|nr:hypothetical protein EC957_002612 [Mortierella hygrophila]
MPFVETLESYSRALYLPLRGYVRQPFLFVSDSIRDHIPRGLWDMRRAIEHTVLGSSKLVGPFDGFGAGSTLNGVASSGSSGAGIGVTAGLTGGGAATANVNASAAAGAGGASGSGVAAAAVSTGGSGSGVINGYGLHNGRLLNSQPSMIHFFTSPYFLLLCFMSIVLNRINAIVAPRNPHPLKMSVRFALKLPSFYLLTKSALITLALVTQDSGAGAGLGLSWMSNFRTSYNESQALWLSFIAMGVSCTIDSFIANLHFNGNHEHTTNMLEWAILFHFTPYGRDILVISLIQVCQLLMLQFLSLSSQGKNYRLAVTTFWGVLDLLHFAFAIYHRSNTYPSLQMLTRLPEVVVILMVGISMTLHALTYIVTGGNVRRQMFEPRAMPTRDEEYGLAVFKVGRACMEATRGVGFRNEVDAVIVPFGTLLDKKKPKSRSTLSSGDQTQGTQAGSSSTSYSFSFGTRGQRFRAPAASGFSNEMADVVETPGQRQTISRRRNRFNVMKEFCVSSGKLIAEMAYGAYNRIVPARFKRTIRPIPNARMSVQDYIQLRTSIENALEKARQERESKVHQFEVSQYLAASALDEEEEKELYSEFLSRDLTVSDDEDEDYDVDYMDLEDSEYDNDGSNTEDENDNAAGSQDNTGGVETPFGIRRRAYDTPLDSEEESESLEQLDGEDEESLAIQRLPSGWPRLGSLQDFFLDTSFMSIFLSGRMQDTPLTRSQHRLVLTGASNNSSNGSSGSSQQQKRSRRRGRRSSDPEADDRLLLAVLNKYRKTVGEDVSAPTPTTTTTPSSLHGDDMTPPPLASKGATSNQQDEEGTIGTNNALVVEAMSKGTPRSFYPDLSVSKTSSK